MGASVPATVGTPISLRQTTSGGFRSQPLHRFGRRADKFDSGRGASARERCVFSQEPVAGMNGVAAGIACHADNLVDGEIAFARGRRTEAISFVGEADVQRLAVRIAEDGHGL